MFMNLPSVALAKEGHGAAKIRNGNLLPVSRFQMLVILIPAVEP